MRIAFISPSLANAGPTIVVQDLCGGLIDQGHTCKVFYFDDICELQMPCEVERIKFSQTIDFTQWDVVHSHMLRPDLWVARHRPCSKSCTTRFISTLHNPITHSVHPLHRNVLLSYISSLVWRLSLRRFDSVVVLNDNTKSTLPKRLQEKSSVIFNGRDVTIAAQISETNHRTQIETLRASYTIIGAVGSLDARKGIDQVIKALVKMPKYAFVVVGKGEQRDYLEALAKDLGVSHRCYFTGYTNKAVEYYSVFDVFVMTSRSEGFPLALIEASSNRIPCVLSNIGVFNAIVPNQQTILQYNLDDIKDLSQKIELAIEQRESLSKNIYQFYQLNLTVKKMTQRYIELYTNAEQLR